MNNIVDVSIDFDYFCYEDLMWDWGHNEVNDIFKNYAWLARYIFAEKDLQEIITLGKADFHPCDVLSKLARKSIKNQAKSLIIGDSHALIEPVLTDSKADTLISLDAHIDYWPREGDEVTCANWMRFIKHKRIINVIPKFRTDKDYKYISENSKTRYLGGILHVSKERVINNIFICKSSAWTPPHMDKHFIEMVNEFKNKVPSDCYINIIGDVMKDRMEGHLMINISQEREKAQQVVKECRSKNAI